MLVRQELDGSVGVLSVTGPLAAGDAPVIVQAVEQALDRHPSGVVVDLREVPWLPSDAATALRRLTDRSPGRPHTSINLCGASPAVRRALTGVVVHPDRTQALMHVSARSATVRQAVLIEHSARGAAQARAVVSSCAAELGLSEEGDDLLLLVSELVTNAVRHGAPPISLEVLADEATVTVAVGDASPSLPLPRHAAPDAEGGRGMTLVDLLTVEHGVRPACPGKTVWASVPRRDPRAI